MWENLYYCSILLCFCLFRLSESTVPPKFTQYLQETIGRDNLVVHLSRLGLANRLRSIADWFNIATISRRFLIVIWDVTDDCKAGFHELFMESQSLVVIDNYDGTTIEEITENFRQFSTIFKVLNGGSDTWTKGGNSFVLNRKAVMNDIPTLFSSYDGVLTMEGVSCQEYLNKHSKFLSNLEAVPSAASFAQSIYDEYFSNSIMVGVHYRAHDPQQDWAVVPPLLGDRTDKIFGEGASVDQFTTIMGHIESSQNSQTLSDVGTPEGNHTAPTKKIRFFVASNNLNAKTSIGAAFPSAIYLGGLHSRSEKSGMELALVEWLILSKGALILHTYGSTFAEEAALVYQRPIVGIWEGKLLHHTSTHLPHCGNQQYARIFSEGRRTATYRTGINTDHSEVRSQSIMYNRCLCLYFDQF